MKRISLFDPLTHGSQQYKNRVVLAPMTRARAGKTRVPNDLMAEYYNQRTSAGLLITEATVISKDGIGWIDSPGIYTEEMMEGWKKVIRTIAPTMTPLFLQLWHCGRVSHSDFHNGELPGSASAIQLKGDHIYTPFGKKKFETPRELSVQEIKKTINDYAQAAINAQEAGFSGIELHGANGYLINQFLDSKSNHRSDHYGGNIENRFRFLREIIEALLAVWPSSQIGVRISPNGVFNDMGSDDFRETYLYLAKALDSYNVGYLHIVDGLDFGFHNKGKAMSLYEFRPLFKGLIIGCCGYTKAKAEERLNEGSADMIAFGRPFISNPDLVERFQNNWSLNPEKDMATWYSPGAKGYTDYERYVPNTRI